MGEAWQAFDTSTEAGRMLKRLYGGRCGQPNIEKPRLVMRKEEAKAGFIPGGARLEARDPRRTTRRDIKVAAPRPTGPKDRKIHAIEVIARRRAAHDIAKETADLKMRCNAYRPPRPKGHSTPNEKMKIQERFQFGGGKALPKEMTQAPGPLPSQELAKEKEAKRIQHERNKRNGLTPENTPPETDIKTQLIDTISSEIQERRRYLTQLEDTHPSSANYTETRRRIDLEISLRTKELARLLSSASES